MSASNPQGHCGGHPVAFLVRLDTHLNRRLVLAAARDGWSMQAVVLEAIEARLSSPRPPAAAKTATTARPRRHRERRIAQRPASAVEPTRGTFLEK